MILAVSLSPSIDRTLLVPQMRLGSIHRPVAVVEVAGGKGLNVARCLQRLGYPTRAAGIVGGPNGQTIQDLADADELRLDIVAGSRNTRVCTSIIDESTSLLTEFYEPATPVTTHEWRRLCEVVAPPAGTVGWVTISGSLPTELPSTSVRQLIDAAQDSGARVALDTHGATLQTALEAAPSLIKVNRFEAASLLSSDEDRSAREVCEQLATVVGTMTIVTDGAAGAWAVSGDGETLHVNSPHRGHYPVGSGDCFLAGLVGALSHDHSFAASLRLASATATANAQVPGPGIFNLHAVEQYLAETFVSTARGTPSALPSALPLQDLLPTPHAH